MVYYIGQALGIIVTVGAILTLQLKKKNQILTVSAIVNILAALNILLLDEFSSGVIINFVAVLQILLSFWHEKKGTEVPLVEKIVFLLLYVGGGAMGFEKWIDLLSIVAAVFYMLAMLQKKEQNIRLLLLANMATWTVYHSILGSTAVFAQLAGIVSSLIALYRYRKTDKNKD
ncbi:MAG: YgjV family protein [Clostridia bacterium]|nr:YgjV family protein [Clostridia bacterium]